jgi:hypothetical protein
VTVSTLTVVPEASASGTAPCAEPLQLPLFEAPLSHHPTPDRRPRLLDLFCGAGGASAGYHAAGFDVTCRCGTPLPPRPATGRWPRYCSHACRQAAYRDRHRTTADGRP